MHILVVDDDRAVCEAVCEALRERGATAESSESDADAYRRLSAAPPLDAVVVDVNLGAGTTGFDVARFARRANRRITVVYVSGAISAVSHRTFGVTGSEFVEKPFVPSELAEQVLRKLACRKA